MTAEGRPTIAVVDDNESTRYATARILRAAGFKILEATNGVEALQRINRSVDVVVLDVNMPDIDGFEVCRHLRKSPETEHIPIIHLSATFVDEADQAHGLEAGADAYLTHPVESRVLVASIGSLLRARKAEAMRHAADAKLRAVFDLAPIGLATLDPELKIQDANPAFCQLLGLPREELVGTRRDYITAPLLEGLRLRQLEQSGEEVRWSGHLPLQRADGTTGQAEWHIVHEHVSGLRILTVADITQQQQLLASERAARSEAVHATRLKDEFLATLSHELRNPLSSILGWTEVLLRAPSQKIEEGLRAIQRGARLQQQLVSDLLDISGMLEGKVRLQVESVDPQDVIEPAIEVVRAAATAKSVGLEYQPGADIPKIKADTARLQQILWNLLTNAVKFTPAGGTVSVRTERVEHELCIDVHDTGQGIAAEFLPHVFDRFRQGETGSNKRVTGLGLGLAITKQLVEMHGGRVEAHSAGLGSGATFRVRLPTITMENVAAVRGVPAKLAGLNVLVVDDDDDHRGWLVRLLSEEGANTIEARSADLALVEITRQKPDVLVSDIGMPGKDGYALMRELRSRGISPDELPAVALTAFTRREDRDAAFAAGYQHHLPKPPSPQQLLEVVAALASEVQVSR